MEELCAAGAELYERALTHGRLTPQEAQQAPCAVHLGLLRPAVEDVGRLEPVAPTVALQRLLRHSEERIAEERRREERLAETFHSLMRPGAPAAQAESTPTLSILSGKEQINEAIAEELTRATDQVLAIHPHSGHNGPLTHIHQLALQRDQAFLDRGGRIRTLYQHTLRHSPTVLARYELLSGDVQARTLDEVTERLMVAMETGGAIRGPVRGDVFWGPGDEAAERAGRMKHPGRAWLLAPRPATSTAQQGET